MSAFLESLGFLTAIALISLAALPVGAYLGMRKAVQLGRSRGIPIRGRTLRSQYHNLIEDLEPVRDAMPDRGGE